ncbi:hypothetical protein PFISCL1PPCAC_27218, partial [Pristionchus fissidentatus]
GQRRGMLCLLLLTLALPTVHMQQTETEDPCPPKLDVAFVMDTSGSIELVYAEHVKWTMALADILPVRQDAVRLAVIQYASYPLTEFSLSTYSSTDNVRKHLQQITFQAGVTRTGYALRKAESELFREDKGARSDADKLLILFSDGLSIDDPIRVAENLRNEKNVTLYVVSVGSEGFATEMERIAGTHDETYGPKDLGKLKANVIKKVEHARVCANGERLSSLTTSSTSTSSTTTTSTTTTTTTTTTPEPTTTTTVPTTIAVKKEEKRPVTLRPHSNNRRAVAGVGSARNLNKPSFIGSQSVTSAPIDLRSEERNSQSVENRKSSERNHIASKETSSEENKRRVVPRTIFTTTTTSTTTPTPSTTHRVQFTRRRSHFTASSTTTTTSTTTEVPTTTTPSFIHRRAPSTRTLPRLHSDERVTRVTAKPWKNPNAPKVKRIEEPEEAVVPSPVEEPSTQVFEDLFTTTERSTTTPSTTTTTKATSTATFRPRSVASRRVARVKSEEELSEKKPPVQRGRAFAVRSKAFEGENDKEKCQVDVLLIVDSSGSVHNIYDTQKTFLASVLEEIDIANHNHRVALIQFAGQNLQKTEWSFDDMSANEQLMKAFGRIRHFTGTTYIGAALHAANRMLDNKRKNVKTLVVLLSDGYSHDNTEIAAEEIRSLQDVELYAVSVAPHTNTSELKKITGDESRIFV